MAPLTTATPAHQLSCASSRMFVVEHPDLTLEMGKVEGAAQKAFEPQPRQAGDTRIEAFMIELPPAPRDTSALRTAHISRGSFSPRAAALGLTTGAIVMAIGAGATLGAYAAMRAQAGTQPACIDTGSFTAQVDNIIYTCANFAQLSAWSARTAELRLTSALAALGGGAMSAAGSLLSARVVYSYCRERAQASVNEA